MNSRQLEYFLAVAKELNFTKAAESMFVSQTAVTQQIKVLEEQLGVNLFERTKRKVVLTPAGKVFQSEAVSILNRMDMAAQKTREVSSGFTGALNIGFTVGIGNTDLAERIQSFSQKYPNISLRFTNLSPVMLLKRLREGEIDVALMPMFDENLYKGITFKKVAWDNMIAVFPQSHVLAQNKYITWHDLKDEPLILPSSSNNEIGEDKKILEGFMRIGCKPRIVDHVEDVETTCLMVALNMGVTILPAYMAAPVSSRGRLVFLPFGGVEDQLDIIAAWGEHNDNPSVERILPFLEGEIPGESSEKHEPVKLDVKQFL